MKLTTKYMTRNDCYNAGRKITPAGIMVHSTAAPGVMAAQWFEKWNKSYKAGEMSSQVCVHAFVDDTGVLQCLPWNHRGWHCGGAANNTHIGFEICEPSGFKYVNNAMSGYDVTAQEAYFRKIWDNAVALCAYLCKLYNLTEKNIICHSEGYVKGIASNHSDVLHWFPKHGKNMNTFRAAVKAALNKKEDEDMTQDKFNELMDGYLKNLAQGELGVWSAKERKWAENIGLIKGDGNGSMQYPSFCTREQMVVFLYRLVNLIKAGL